MEELKKEIRETISETTRRVNEDHGSSIEAMQLSQAVLNLANALACLGNRID